MSYTINTPYHGALLAQSGNNGSSPNNSSIYRGTIAMPAGIQHSVADLGMVNTNMQQMGQVPSHPAGVIPAGAQYDFADPAMKISANQNAVPRSTTITVTSVAAAGAAPTVVYLLNQNSLNNIVNNGSGAGSITYTYQDGFGGNNLSQILAFARYGVGMTCFGGYIRMMTNTTPPQGDPSGLDATNPAFLFFNTYGRSTPSDINIADDQTRADQDTSIEVFTCMQNITTSVQFSFLMPVGDTATVTLYFNPYFRR